MSLNKHNFILFFGLEGGCIDDWRAVSKTQFKIPKILKITVTTNA
jgi:hypothetical protein